MDRDVKQAQQRAYRYWYTDGLAEIIGGATFVIVGVLIYIKDLLFQSLLASVITIAFLLILAIGVRILIRVLKERLTYPRTGYVAYRKRKVSILWIRLGVGLTLGAVAGALTTMEPESRTWFPLILGGIIAVFFLVLGQKLSLPRFYALCLFSILLGAGISLIVPDRSLHFLIYLVGMGSVQVVTGGIALTRYLRANPQPVEEPYE